MCPCDPSIHYLCGYHRGLIVDDLLTLRQADADGRSYDDDIRLLRGRLATLGWEREAVERDLDYGGEAYAREPRRTDGAAA
jgi:hypothetical protein